MSELAFLLGMAFLAGVGCGGALAGLCSRPLARTDDPTHPEGSVTTSDNGGVW